MTNQENGNRVIDGFINVAVPTHLYPKVLRVLADCMAEPPEAAEPMVLSPHAPGREYYPEQIRQFRSLIADNVTAFTMMEMTSENPGVRVSFKEVRKRAGLSHGKARADLAGLSRITGRLGWPNWPVHVEKGPDGAIVYDASPEIAAAWKAAAKK